MARYGQVEGRRVGGWLVALGVLALLVRGGAFGSLPAFLWTSAMFATGAAVWVLGGRLGAPGRLAVFAAVGVLATATAGPFAGTAALGFLGLGFALSYAARPERWWTLIPAGLFASLASVTAIQALFPRWDAAPLFLLGMAATFTILYLLPRERGGKAWALYPALFWIVVTVLANDPAGSMPGWLLPALLIGGGAFLLWGWRRDR